VACWLREIVDIVDCQCSLSLLSELASLLEYAQRKPELSVLSLELSDEAENGVEEG